MDAKQLADELFATVKQFLLRNVQPLYDRVKALEERPVLKGDPGQPGPQGERGEPGPAGEAGQIGPTGPAGERGEKGEPGQPGEPGTAGKDGADGRPGEPGPAGEKGEKGERGDPGPAGERGEKGDKGDPGEPGPAGKDGAPGPQGEPGPAGAKGADGLHGKDGAPGERGEKGDAGEPGRDGRDGEPGRDAVHIDVLDGIDPAKRYQRGTYAYHRGGMVRAFKATDPLAPGADLEKHGWHVVVRGLDDCAVEMDEDLRTLRVRLSFSDGAVVHKQLTVPTMIYRGIWAEGQHQRGDVVTRDGSSWVAKADTTTRPGDDGSDWQLAVKRGRDGRDGLKGEKGDRGAEGRPGIDRRI